MQARAFVLIAVLALAIGVLWLARKDQRPAAFASQTPTPAPAVTAALPSPTASPTPSPGAPAERRTTVILPWESEPTPSPTGPEEEPTVRPGPSPTPETPECVAVSYSAGVVPGTLGGVLVDIRAENHCGRDLGPSTCGSGWAGTAMGSWCRAFVDTPLTRSSGTVRAKPPSCCRVPSTGTTASRCG